MNHLVVCSVCNKNQNPSRPSIHRTRLNGVASNFPKNRQTPKTVVRNRLQRQTTVATKPNLSPKPKNSRTFLSPKGMSCDNSPCTRCRTRTRQKKNLLSLVWHLCLTPTSRVPHPCRRALPLPPSASPLMELPRLAPGGWRAISKEMRYADHTTQILFK